MDKHRALQIFDTYFHGRERVLDFAGQWIERDAFEDENSLYAWTLDLIKPQTMGGIQTDINLIPCALSTKKLRDQKSSFRISNAIFEVRKGKKYNTFALFDVSDHNHPIDVASFGNETEEEAKRRQARIFGHEKQNSFQLKDPRFLQKELLGDYQLAEKKVDDISFSEPKEKEEIIPQEEFDHDTERVDSLLSETQDEVIKEEMKAVDEIHEETDVEEIQPDEFKRDVERVDSVFEETQKEPEVETIEETPIEVIEENSVSEEELRKEEEKNQALEARINELVEELNKLHISLQEEREKNEKAQTLYTQLQEESEGLEEEKVQAEEELALRANELNELNEKLSQKEAETQEISQKLTIAKESLNEKENSLSEKDEMIHQLEEKITSLQKELEEKQNQQEELTDQENQKQEELSSLYQQLLSVREELRQNQENYETLKDEKEALSQEKETLLSEKEDIEKEKAEISAEKETLSDSIHTLEEENNNLKNQIDDLTKESEALLSLQKQMEEINEKHQELENQILEKEEQLQKLQEEYNNLQKEKEETEAEDALYADQMEALKYENTTIKEELEDAKSQLESLRNQNEELNSQKNSNDQTFAKLNDENHEKEERIKELLTSVEEKENRIVELNTEKETISQEKENLYDKNMNLSGEYSKLKDELAEVKAQLEEKIQEHEEQLESEERDFSLLQEKYQENENKLLFLSLGGDLAHFPDLKFYLSDNQLQFTRQSIQQALEEKPSLRLHENKTVYPVNDSFQLEETPIVEEKIEAVEIARENVSYIDQEREQQIKAFGYWEDKFGEDCEKISDFAGRIISKKEYNNKESEEGWNYALINPDDREFLGNIFIASFHTIRDYSFTEDFTTNGQSFHVRNDGQTYKIESEEFVTDPFDLQETLRITKKNVKKNTSMIYIFLKVIENKANSLDAEAELEFYDLIDRTVRRTCPKSFIEMKTVTGNHHYAFLTFDGSIEGAYKEAFDYSVLLNSYRHAYSKEKGLLNAYIVLNEVNIPCSYRHLGLEQLVALTKDPELRAIQYEFNISSVISSLISKALHIGPTIMEHLPIDRTTLKSSNIGNGQKYSEIYKFKGQFYLYNYIYSLKRRSETTNQ